MGAYIIKRDNQLLGPFTTQQLKLMGLLATDLMRQIGGNHPWTLADEIEELQAFVQGSSIVTSNGELSKRRIKLESQEPEPDLSVLPHPKESPDPPEAKSPKNDPMIREDRERIQPTKNPRIIPESRLTVEREGILEGSAMTSSPSAQPIRVIITDDHWLFRDGVKMAMSAKKDIQIIGEAENGLQLLHLLKHRKPDVILLDIQMPVMDGIAALKAIRQTDRDIKVIILSMHEGHSMVTTLMETGANGYLTKTADPESIYTAIRTCHDKGYYFNDLTNLSILEELKARQHAPEKVVKPVFAEPSAEQAEAEFDGAVILQKLASKKQQANPLPRYSSLRALVVAATSLALIAGGIWGGMFLKSHPEWLRVTLPADYTTSTAVGSGKDNPAGALPLKPVEQEPTATHTQTAVQDTLNRVPSVSPDPAPVVENKPVLEKKSSPSRKDTARIRTKPVQTLPVQTIVPAEILTEKKPAPAEPERKVVDKLRVLSQISANANKYKTGVFGGLSNMEIYVRNASDIALDDVTVEVSYLTANDNVFKTEALHSGHIAASASQTISVPPSSRGVRIEYKIVSVKSKEMDQ
jgi:DNA-binding NarL/FixJ family response regulator